jgi:probable rRNA maturation factor
MILNRQREVRVSPRALELFLRRVQGALGIRKMDITVCLVSEAEIAGLNQKFRSKRGPTDVLSFPAGEQKKALRAWRKPRRAALRKFLGDIAISPATAERYAKNSGRAVSSELRVLVLHGVLHLLGFDHEADRGEMEKFEMMLRIKLGLAS